MMNVSDPPSSPPARNRRSALEAAVAELHARIHDPDCRGLRASLRRCGRPEDAFLSPGFGVAAGVLRPVLNFRNVEIASIAIVLSEIDRDFGESLGERAAACGVSYARVLALMSTESPGLFLRLLRSLLQQLKIGKSTSVGAPIADIADHVASWRSKMGRDRLRGQTLANFATAGGLPAKI
jgi:hypothetical protein